MTQDGQSLLRQKYVDVYGATPPAHSALDDANSYSDPGNLLFDDAKCKGSSYCGNHAFQYFNTVLSGFQSVRDQYGGAITVTSCYRCPTWNKHEGGGDNSKHIWGNAFDFDNGSTSTNWNIAQAADSAGISHLKILLYKDETTYKNLKDLIDGGYNATNLPPGWTEYDFGHISTD